MKKGVTRNFTYRMEYIDIVFHKVNEELLRGVPFSCPIHLFSFWSAMTCTELAKRCRAEQALGKSIFLHYSIAAAAASYGVDERFLQEKIVYSKMMFPLFLAFFICCSDER